MTLNELLDAALTMSSDDRLLLADALHDSVNPEDWPAPSQAWQEEINRRSAELDAGNVVTFSWEEVRTAARRKAGLDG